MKKKKSNQFQVIYCRSDHKNISVRISPELQVTILCATENHLTYHDTLLSINCYANIIAALNTLTWDESTHNPNHIFLNYTKTNVNIHHTLDLSILND